MTSFSLCLWGEDFCHRGTEYEVEYYFLISELMKRGFLKLTFLVVLSLSAAIFTSCEKDAGEGGEGIIRGRVYGFDYNAAGILHDSGYVGGVRVYISYGDHTWVDDDVRTSATGDYAFQGLHKGDYTLFVISECDSCNFNQAYVTQRAKLSSEDEELVLPDFIIRD
jgi:hypothetical protein